MSIYPPLQSKIRHPLPLALCIALTLLYGVLSYTAVSGKSSTYDEPMHALGSWVHRHHGDFRINFEDPPLWQYWATLLNGRDALKVDWNNPYWMRMPEYIYYQWTFTLDTLYRTPGNDGEAFVRRERLMMVILGMVLCAMVALWSWRLSGPVAAVIATALTALDPNLLGHGALVKNDVPMGLMMAAVFFMCWRVGERLTWANGIGLAALVAAAVNVKFSSLLFGPMLIILMGLRILLPVPWEFLGKSLVRWHQKAAAVVGLFAAIGIVSYIAIWACYGFRFDPSPDPAVKLNTYLHKSETIKSKYQVGMNPPPFRESNPSLSIEQLLTQFVEQFNSFAKADNDLRQALAGAKIEDATRQEILQRLARDEMIQKTVQEVFERAKLFLPQNVPAPENRAADFAQQYLNAVTNLEQLRAGLWNEEHNPSPLYNGIRLYVYWASVGDEAPDRLVGLLDTAMNYKLLPSAFLNGVLFVHARSIIRGSYLMGSVSPTGWWYYFPLAMLFKTPVATLGALAGAMLMGGWLLIHRLMRWRSYVWPLACLLVPIGIYMVSVMSANLNIGIRHVLCVYPIMYIAAAALIVRALGRWPWIVRMHMVVLGTLLLIESLVAWPNHIAYFNFAVGGSRGGLKLLADSNLDWGQDLPLLRDWREKHMDAPLSLHYFGIAELAVAKNEKGEPIAQVSDWRTLPRFYKIPYDEPELRQTSMPIDPDPAKMKGRYVAISATELQGVYSDARYAAYKAMTPMTVLGGTIYIYDLRK